MTSRHRPGEYTRSRLYDPGYDTKVLEVLEVPWRQISTDSGTDEIEKDALDNAMFVTAINGYDYVYHPGLW